MQEDILSLIQENAYKFSKGQRAIAAYISRYYDKAAFMTANKLGKTVGVSESTVVRFASELGYDGYPGMQRALQEMIRSRLTSTQRIQVAGDRFSGQDILFFCGQTGDWQLINGRNGLIKCNGNLGFYLLVDSLCNGDISVFGLMNVADA